MKGFDKWASRQSDKLLCLVRKWWRPWVCASIGGTIFVNGILIPILNKTSPELVGLAALITAAAPFAWIRSQEKLRGVDAPVPTGE